MKKNRRSIDEFIEISFLWLRPNGNGCMCECELERRLDAIKNVNELFQDFVGCK